MKRKRVAIIGAGSSGITAVKALKDRGFDVVCFEASDRVGGNWVYHNKNQMSACYRDLHINTSKRRMQYSDYPMPDSYPDYSDHRRLAQYFQDYVNHFQLAPLIRFESKVEKAEREDDLWRIELADGSEEIFDALVVANGHHWQPRWPQFPGSFAGVEMHAHEYDNSDFAEDKTVVVVGLGNSAADIAVETSYQANQVYLSIRRGDYIIPKYIFGLPTDEITKYASPRLPIKLRQKLFTWLIRLYVGNLERFGLPKPEHNIGQTHPTISSRLLDRLGGGAIIVKPNISHLDGHRVYFTDRTFVIADIIIYCTGYQIAFPFFDEDIIKAEDNQIDLYKNVFHPEIDNLFFVGLIQPLGAIMPLAEAQSKMIADYLAGQYQLPSRLMMTRDISERKAAMQRRYLPSKRHTIQVDFDDYLRELQRR